jgi:integrase
VVVYRGNQSAVTDDPDPQAPLWPSERLAPVVAALNVASPACPVGPDAFRRALAGAATRHLTGPVQHLHPHLLRHACATHNYESGMPLWDVQQLLGHGWASTTVGYLTTARGDPERHSLESSARAVRRLTTEG